MATLHLQVTPVEGTVTTPRGYRAAGIRCGIKPAGSDLALIVSDRPAAAAGTFTTNRVRSAPVILSEARLASGRAQAVVINSGNANACTGARGAADAQTMADAAAAALGIAPDLVLVASTGVIGRPLPIEKITAAMPALISALGPDGLAAARAIMTTDAFPKTAAAQVHLGDGPISIGGIAKGAGMIHPNMATMIAVLTTDAAVDPALLRAALRSAVDQTFNCISVDGDTSTSDSVFLLANGAAGISPIAREDDRYAAFLAGLIEVAGRLARRIVEDGEGTTRVIQVTVRGARSDADARRAGQTVMTSLLVKTAFHGAELNWGRLAAAVGRSGAEVDPDRLAIAIGDVVIVRDGVGIAEAYPIAEPLVREALVRVVIDLGLGDGEFTGWTSDLGETYVRINSGYLT
ncbi:MAG: bifunctional glutamate N-acetyltransferase/amino-acid acetyltransferase ArgJ [Armatimonadota bacterium]|nr:bifunctional glutamate N-acetyltransferase/amino-acid acetyltransferase ArgJ [Armatimonadota bacterium]MDR7519163.1 bifunctional glutamate N-acetyltransferase/amino-acid acetyltransferase ArgJ [Armatimonadota bacterium]MDR7550953.1 bifunctional glutamate N-acetyltransferase/amino-acid acetyltransferase ArgJ [Armatimonadota bacterium]